MKIILASSSPRRKDILDGLPVRYSIVHPSADESVLSGETPLHYASRISSLKALAVSSQTGEHADAVIIGADTIVAIGGKILGKPRDFNDAFGMLRSLSGNTHEVITALTVVRRLGFREEALTRSAMTRVSFKKIGDEEIKQYMSLVDYTDKAGSYAFQEHRGMIISKVEGSFTNVIGFPLRTFFMILSEMGLAGIVFGVETGVAPAEMK